MVQAITTPSLKLFWSTADFIKILKESNFPIDLYGWLAKYSNHNTKPMEKCLNLKIFYKIHKYRQRDEGMFSQQVVEEIYDRYLTHSVGDFDSWNWCSIREYA